MNKPATFGPSRLARILRRILVAGDLLVALALFACLFGRLWAAAVLAALAWCCLAAIVGTLLTRLEPRP